MLLKNLAHSLAHKQFCKKKKKKTQIPCKLGLQNPNRYTKQPKLPNPKDPNFVGHYCLYNKK